ncbi:flagellar hook-length control protein FliK [Methylomonas rapida]|uniref:Flagellar hook-length control protein FliK n=1 Tax=Methylomonas rapida TaxID=2963939 RepID=A0ABY7GDS4_9GAMM|nr:flagellar hook-length control protein FliK [Methylomonas rapida]WAR43437.1 flagellar hook-length control protein FliK [Methylomonas rapida]
MNIQGVNLLSLLSGSENLGNLQQGLLGSADGEAGFASALMEQLGLLQGKGASPDLAAIQDWMDSAKNGNAEPGLQGFAAWFGKDLPPTANKTGADIDLEDTLQTLAGVLQELQQLDADAPIDVPALDTLKVDGDSAPVADDGDAAANVAAFVPIFVPAPELQDNAEPLTELSEPSVSFANKSAVANPQAGNPDERLESASTEADMLGPDFDRSISAMLAEQGADGKSQQDKNNLGFKAENLLNQMEQQTDGGEAGKTLPGVAADIARLNQAVRGEASPVPAQPAMSKHFADPAWNKELGEKLIWMHKQSIPSVELRLNPEHLGPVLVRIDVNQDQAHIAFTAQHLAVKDAIEAAIPKLREMFSGQQLNLADVNVSQQQSDQRQQARDFFQMASEQHRRDHAELDTDGNGTGNAAQNLVDEIEAGRAVASNGLLSLFA